MSHENELYLVFQVFIAGILGIIIGWEREIRGHDAGLRTYAAATIGACLFGLVSTHCGITADPSRIASQVVTGMGFLGAGVIMRRDTGRISGLTTAASLWACSAIGLAIAFDKYILGASTTILLYLLLRAPHPPKAKVNEAKGENNEQKE
jgi:putative Mg2+ transporter-C (MgtC) family protein